AENEHAKTFDQPLHDFAASLDSTVLGCRVLPSSQGFNVLDEQVRSVFLPGVVISAILDQLVLTSLANHWIARMLQLL
ncbi:hypothetical protein KIN20_006385, partial [Parelaphostrongylus tenuis]